jgi:hypothetical protein
MRVVRRFLSDKKGATFEGIALSAAMIAVASVATADLLSYMGKRGDLPNMALVRESSDLMQVARSLPKPTPGAGAADADVDYAPTGTITGLRQRSVLDPCTGARK